MGTFIVYIIKSAVCLILFYLFYKLLLSKDTFHKFNRFALLSLLLMSFVIPVVKVSLHAYSRPEQTVESQNQYAMQATPVEIIQTATIETMPESSQSTQTKAPILLIYLLILTYLAGMFLYCLHQLWSIVNMFKLMKKSQTAYKGADYTLLVHRQQIAPFSWMNYIVISEKDLEENAKEILSHELAHIHKKHSFDLLIADCCILFQWFNPAAWLLKQELQSIHEYEADDMVLNQGIDAKQYQLLIIKKAVGKRLYSMSNSFNHSSLKKRITMMLKEKSNPWARLKYACILPLACATVLAFARPDVSRLEKQSVEKVNDFIALSQAKNTAVQSRSADKINEISGQIKSEDGKSSIETTYAKANGLTEASDHLAYAGSEEKAPVEKTQKTAETFTKPVISKSVSGKVISLTDKQPLSSTSICEIDPAGRILTATVSKEDGSFELKVKNADNQLRFSLIGYKNMKAPIKQNMSIQMEEATVGIGETVVVGYAPTQKNVNATPTSSALNNDGEIKMVEAMPQYPGGEKALREYLCKNIIYPSRAIEKGIEGRVVCSCIINETGEVTNVKVVKSVDPDLDYEAKRIIENMPNWTPGMQNGKAKPVRYAIPITFKKN
ncbi:MAG: TonB family protein [Bacteroidota bacterium]|nr:TonB family protein [Bacteroidota bacterium]